jgi:hypothetical protein
MHENIYLALFNFHATELKGKTHGLCSSVCVSNKCAAFLKLGNLIFLTRFHTSLCIILLCSRGRES